MNLFENSLNELSGKATPEYLKAAAELFSLVEGMDSKIPLKATLRRPGEQPAPQAEPAQETPAPTKPAAPDFSGIVEPLKTAVKELAQYPAIFDKLMGSRSDVLNRLGMLAFATNPKDLAAKIADLFQYYPENAAEIVNTAYNGSEEAAAPAAQAVDKLQNAFAAACDALSKRSGGDSIAALNGINQHFKPIYAPNDRTTNRFKKATGEKSHDANKPTADDVNRWAVLRTTGKITDESGKETNANMLEIDDAAGDNSKASVKAKLDKSADIELLLFTGARQIVKDMDFVSEDEQKSVEMMYKVSKYMLTRQLRTLCARKLPKEMSSQDVFMPTTVFGANYFDVTEYNYDEGTWLEGLPSGYITAKVKDEYREILLPVIKYAMANIRTKELDKRPFVIGNVNYVATKTDEENTEETEETENKIDRIHDETFNTKNCICIQVVPKAETDVDTLKNFINDTIKNFRVIGISASYMEPMVEEVGDGSYYVGVNLGGYNSADKDIMLNASLRNKLYFVMSAIFAATYREAIKLGCEIQMVGIDPAIRKVLEDPSKKAVVAQLANKFSSSDFRDNKAFYRNNGAMDSMKDTSYKSVNRNEILRMWTDSNADMANEDNEVEVNQGTAAVLYALSEFIMNNPVDTIITQLNQLIDGDATPSKLSKDNPESFLGKIRSEAVQKYGALDGDDDPESEGDVDAFLDEVIDDVFTNSDFIEQLCSRIYPQFVNGADVKKVWKATAETDQYAPELAGAIDDMLESIADYINKVTIDKFLIELKKLPVYDPKNPDTMSTKPSDIATSNPDSFLGKIMVNTLGKPRTQKLALVMKSKDEASGDEIVQKPLNAIFMNSEFVRTLADVLASRNDSTTNFMDTGLSLYANVANKNQFDRTKYFGGGHNYDNSIQGQLNKLRDISHGKNVSGTKTTKEEPKKSGGFVAEFDGDEDDDDIEL